MKICPKCQQTYNDDNLNFCLNDGAILVQTKQPNAASTNFTNQARPANQNQPFANQSNEQMTWDKKQPYSIQPKKSSKTWIWVVGILCLVGLVCGGGGLVVLLALAGINANSNSGINDNTLTTNRTISNIFPSNSKTVTNSGSVDRTDVQSINLESWVRQESSAGITEYNNGELTMGSLKKNFYYVLVASYIYKTENATTKVTVKNFNRMNSSMGYGLIFHSNPIPLNQDYAFLIDTMRKKYRIVYHQPQKETAVVNWTNSDAILDGAAENILEVRDENGSIDFYINGEKVNTVKNVYGYAGGVVGLYSGDAAQITFSNLEIRK